MIHEMISYDRISFYDECINDKKEVFLYSRILIDLSCSVSLENTLEISSLKESQKGYILAMLSKEKISQCLTYFLQISVIFILIVLLPITFSVFK